MEGTSYLVCATQRSGSTLLCELLKGTEVAGVPDEFFEACAPPVCLVSLASTSRSRPGRHRRPLGADRSGRPELPGEFAGWFSYVLQRGTTRNGVFGAKMMWNYFDDFRARIAALPGLEDLTFNEALEEVFPRLRIIFVRRRDKVAQAVSLWKAIQTQQWRTTPRPAPTDGARSTEPSTTSGHQAPARRASPMGQPVGGLVPRHRPRTDPGHLRGVRRNPRRDDRAVCSTRLGVDPPEPEGQGRMKRQADELPTTGSPDSGTKRRHQFAV